MKKTYFIYLILIFGIIGNLHSQSTEIEIVSLPSNVHLYSNTPKAAFNIRAGSGMTIIKETFDGELWEEDAKAAVSYACRLMEEYLPTMYPIEIKMLRKQNLYTDYVKTSVNLSLHDGLLHPRATLKRNAIIYDKNMTYNDIYSKNDAIILFSPDDIFSTRLDGEVEYDKYDLVTVTLRELAKVLTMNSTVSQVKGKNELSIYKDWVDEDGNSQGKYITPYVNALLNSDLNKTPSEFYDYFTSNDVYIESWHDSSPIKIYAPNKFNKNTSLIYFDEDPNNKETLLFQPTLPKGTAIHYIGSGLKLLFKHLGWYYIQRPNTIGVPNKGQYTVDTNVCNATKEFIINSDGSIQNTNRSKKTTNRFRQENNLSHSQTTSYNEQTTLKNIYPYMQEDGVWAQGDYGVYNDDAIMYKTLFLLKNDGTLHIVKKCDSGLPIYVNLDTLMSNISSFARTSDGLLRFRLNDNEWKKPTGNRHNKVTFFNAGINPPQPKLALKKNYLKSAPSDPDSYYEEKNLAFSDMEGVTSATMIETVYDEYGPISTTTYPVDVQSGNFIATIDKELKTVYQLVSKNQFGETRSNTYTFLPDSRKISVEALINNGVLQWRFVDEFKQPVKIIAKEALLTNLTHPAINIRREISDYKMNIQNLPQGVYNLTLKDNKNNTYNSKVIKTE